MEYTREQLSAFQADFAVRKRRQIAVAVVIALGAVLLMILPAQPALGRMPGILLPFAAMAAILVFTLQNWRCPACGRYLGRGSNPAFCPRCGVPLR
jgi:hypothetical protein